MDPDIQSLLDEGIASLRVGNKEEARQKLMQVINADERNEYAWLYLSEAVDSDEDRQICLENVLAVNPANERAETQLKALEEEKAGQQGTTGDLVCPTCGTTNPPGSQRCLNCYADLEQIMPTSSRVSAESIAGEAGIAEPAPREVQHKSFMEMLDTWAEMFTLPGQARLDEEQPYARWGLTIPGILLASTVIYFFVALTNVGSTLLLPQGTLDLMQLLPIACGGAIAGALGGLVSFFIYSGLYYLFARVLRGTGEFAIQSYLLSLVYGPYSLVMGIIAPLMLLSAVQPALAVIPGLILLVVSVLALIMTVRALKSTHSYGTWSALGTLFLPGIVFCCIGALLSTLLGETLTTTLPFILSEFQ